VKQTIASILDQSPRTKFKVLQVQAAGRQRGRKMKRSNLVTPSVAIWNS